MWRGPPPVFVFFACFVGLGPAVGGLIAYLLVARDAGPGPDSPADVASIVLWGAYVIGLLPALLTGTVAALTWRAHVGRLGYLAVCCGAGMICSAAMVIPLVQLGTLESDRELRELLVFMAACGAGAALAPALATLPSGSVRQP